MRKGWLLFLASLLLAASFIQLASSMPDRHERTCSNPMPNFGFCEGTTCVKDYYVFWPDSSCNAGGSCWCAYEFDYAKHPNIGDGCTKSSDCIPACTSWTYSDWSSCSNGVRTRTIASSSPPSCAGGSPALSESCTASNGGSCTSAGQCLSGYCNAQGACANMPPVQCASFTYSDWSSCSNGVQTRTATGSPAGCAGTAPSSETSRSCAASNGGSCTAGSQCSSGYCSPSGSCDNPPLKSNGASCTSGTQCQSGYCNPQNQCATPTVACTGGWTCTSWSACSNGVKTCTAATGSTPSGCTGGTAPLSTITSSSGCAQPTHSVCSSYSCTQAAGAGSNECASDYFCKKDDGASCTSAGQCKSGSCSWSWSNWKFVCGAGDSQPEPQCTGSTPSNANLCSGDSSGLSQDTTKSVVSACTDGRKCEYTCASGYELSGGQCSFIVLDSVQLSSGAWEDMRGNSISGAATGDRVTMKLLGAGLSGKQVTFRWYKQGQSSPLGSATVTAGVDAFAATSAAISASGTVYFKASADGKEVTSSSIAFSATSSNSAPVVSITSPSEGAIYFTGSSVSFAHSSYDSDSNITSVQWRFGDGDSSSQSQSTHTYSTSGQKTVLLTVTDEQGASTTQSRSILIASPNSYAVFASINKPFNQEAVVSSGLIVGFEAKSSYVLKTTVTGTSPCAVTVECAAGSCPSSTTASPSCAPNPNAAVQISSSSQPYSQMSFSWAFRDGDSLLSAESGMGKVSGTKGFSSPGSKNISVEVKYSANGTEHKASRSNTFILFNQRQCSPSGAIWNKVSGGVVVEQRDTLSTAACAGLDLQAGTNDDCCPDGFMCSTSGTVGCKVDSDAPLGCSSYTTSAACVNDASNRVANEIVWDYYNCGRSTDGKNSICSCAWNSQKSKCEFSTTNRQDANPLSGSISSCIYTSETGECANGYQNVIIHASSQNSSSSECADSTQVMPCGKPVVALPFFGYLNLAAAIALIIIVYIALRRQMKEGKKGKSSTARKKRNRR